jgi:hypothetical protein
MSVFETSLETLKARIADVEITPQTLIFVLKYAMEIIELSELQGSEQKEMALRLIKSVVIESSMSEERKNLCVEMIVSGTLGQTIDLVIDATKGRIQINQALIIDTATKCAPLLCGSCNVV